MFRKSFKAVLFVALTVVVGLIASGATAARPKPPPKTKMEAPGKAPINPTGALNCQSPVEYAAFIKGLDLDETVVYKNGHGFGLVYVDKGLKCRARGMSVIFKISDIVKLEAITVTEEMVERGTKDLLPGDPVIEKAKAFIGAKFFTVGLRDFPLGKLLHRRINDRLIKSLSVTTIKNFGPPATLSAEMQATADAYQATADAYQAKRASATVWARVTWAAAVPPGRFGQPPGVVIDLDPYKLEG